MMVNGKCTMSSPRSFAAAGWALRCCALPSTNSGASIAAASSAASRPSNVASQKIFQALGFERDHADADSLTYARIQ